MLLSAGNTCRLLHCRRVVAGRRGDAAWTALEPTVPCIARSCASSTDGSSVWSCRTF